MTVKRRRIYSSHVQNNIDDVNNVKVELSGKTTLRACAVSVMPGKTHNKIPTCSSLKTS